MYFSMLQCLLFFLHLFFPILYLEGIFFGGGTHTRLSCNLGVWRRQSPAVLPCLCVFCLVCQLCLCMWAGEDNHRLCYHVCVCFVWCVSCVCVCGLAKTITGCVTMFVCVLFGVLVVFVYVGWRRRSPAV